MRAFFQELKTNGRRRTAPQRGGRRPIRFRRQAPALGRPHGIDHIRAPSTPTRGLAALFALPRPTAHHGRRPSGTRHPNPRPRTNQQQRPRPHANKDLRPQHRPHTGPDRPHTPPSQRLHHRPHDISHDVAARGTTTRRTGTTAPTNSRTRNGEHPPPRNASKPTFSTRVERRVLGVDAPLVGGVFCVWGWLGLIGVCIGMRWRGWWLVSRLRRWLGMWGAGVGR